MTQFKTTIVGAGTRLQSGIPKRRPPNSAADATGMLKRGVVTATYVVDDPQHPFADSKTIVPSAVYCDVIAFGRNWQFIPKCLVSQERSGLHTGRIWKPRAATQTFTGDPVDMNKGTNPANLDGDHVLVGFLDGNFNQPLILRSLPHPGADVGNEEKKTGHRLKLVDGDGDPDLWKHNGVYYGVTGEGDFKVDSTHANAGNLKDNGAEQAPSTSGLGNQYYDLPEDAKHGVRLNDVSDPTTLTPTAQLLFQKALRQVILDDAASIWEVLIESGATLRADGKDGDATFKVGDGAVVVAIANHLKDLWNQWASDFLLHTHIDGLGGTGAVNSGSVTSWDSTIESGKVSIPDG